MISDMFFFSITSDNSLYILRNKASSACILKINQQCTRRLKQRQQYYEQFITGEIDRQTHQKFKTDCTAQIERLNNQLATYRQSANNQQVKVRTTDIAKSVINESTSSKEVVDMLIDKIHVFPDNRLEITWKVSGFSEV
jgi:hypothetical protein